MNRRRYQDRAQLALELDRPHREPPVARDTKGLVETLADLLLEALGMPVTGGGDEQQDHA